MPGTYISPAETGLYYLESRYYDPEVGRFINADGLKYLGEGNELLNYNLYTYCLNNPSIYKQSLIFGGSSSGIFLALSVDSISSGSLGIDNLSVSNPSAAVWVQTVVGAIPDIITGIQYLMSRGTHTRFGYSTAKIYRYPILGGKHRSFNKNLYNYGDLAVASFKQIVSGNARASFGSMIKSFGKTAGLTSLVNFGFNLYENNWQTDSDMLLDTTIDTTISVGSYCLATGTMSLITAGVLAATSWAIPGVIVVGSVFILSIGFDALIRWITGYEE